mgnify:CR=1 FL=1
MKKKRTLYDCSHARVQGKRIYCNRGYPLSPKSDDGSIDIGRLAMGEPLALNVCQACREFDCMGPPVPEYERGWPKEKEASRNGGRNRETIREAVAPGRRQALDRDSQG